MQNFMMVLFSCSFTMSALALLYMAATPLLSKHYAAKGRYYTWLVVVVGLIIPFRPHFDSAIVNVNVPQDIVLPISRIGIGRPVIEQISPAVQLPAFSSMTLWRILPLLWLAGMAAFLAYHAVKHCRFIKLIGRFSESVTEGPAYSMLESLRAEVGISKPIGLHICEVVCGPMLSGVFQPKIILPEMDFAEDELRFILVHELVHFKRKDLLYKVLVLFAAAIHWFNPAVYLMAKAIDVQCELSCDEEVIRSTDANTRLHYSETIIGVIKYQSKLRTVLSTQFYGGKRGMKERIFSIMDMNKKKTGVVILCGALVFTFGTGFAFAADKSPQNQNVSHPETIKEDIVVSPWSTVAFLPDPEIYAKYSALGITISDDGSKLLYEGRPVRLFVDEKSDTESFYLDFNLEEAGALDLSVVRNTLGEITGIESIPAQKAQEYQTTFFTDEPGAVRAAQDNGLSGKNKYDQYQPFGITYSMEDETLYYNGEWVKLLVDQYADGWTETFWTEEAGTVNLAVIRNTSGQIERIDELSEEEAQNYRTAVYDNL